MTDITAEDLVSAGTAFLDKIDPSWPELIDLDEFDIGNPQVCVIGQTFCHQLFRDKADAAGADEVGRAPTPWTAGTWAVSDIEGVEDHSMADYGFDTYWDPETGHLVGYMELEEAWRDVIAERQTS